MTTINIVTPNVTIAYAAEELKKYLSMMMPGAIDTEILHSKSAASGYKLGLMQDFGLDVSDAEDTALDDIIYIDCDGEGGIIAGSNPRSVLIAVYEYLRQNGCRWLFPGVSGEFIPERSVAAVKYRFKPTSRYRGQCLEGACIQQSQLEMIEFMPKLGMNTFMIQFFNPVAMYRRYYEHQANEENRTPRKVSERQGEIWKRQCEIEIEKRGLMFHDVGHGWTAEPFGINTATGWARLSEAELLPEESRQYLAEVNGRRGIHSSSLNTNFCMSNPEARKKVVDYITAYSKSHRTVTHLHIWLADGSNNHCECSECRKMSASDWYVVLLNDIDAEFQKEGLDTRIVFISYVDTMWAPQKERLNNEDRFLLMIAPFFRSYAYSMPNGRGNTVVIPYQRNKNVYPSDLASSLDYLDGWNKVWGGNNMSFEYHLWKHQAFDISGLDISERLYTDVQMYRENGLDGIIACCTQRCFFPSGLALYVFARALYNAELSFDEIVDDYMLHAYGERFKEIKSYLTRLCRALPFEYFSREESRKRPNLHYDPEMAKKIAEIRSITKDGRALIDELRNGDEEVRSLAFRLLELHADFCDLISDWLFELANGSLDSAREKCIFARVEFGKNEAEIEKYFEHFLYFREYFNVQTEEETKSKKISTNV